MQTKQGFINIFRYPSLFYFRSLHALVENEYFQTHAFVASCRVSSDIPMLRYMYRSRSKCCNRICRRVQYAPRRCHRILIRTQPLKERSAAASGRAERLNTVRETPCLLTNSTTICALQKADDTVLAVRMSLLLSGVNRT